MIWLGRSRIGSVADLKGKTIAIPGIPFQEGFLAAALRRSGLSLRDVKVEKVGYGLVPTLLSGKADAIFPGSANVEGAELEVRGARPVIVRSGALGLPDYEELVVIASSKLVSEEPQLVHDFMAAVTEGAAAAETNPKAAVKAVATARERNPETSPAAVRSQVMATLPLLSRDGHMDPDRVQSLVEWMAAQGLIDGEPTAESLLSNDYLPR